MCLWEHALKVDWLLINFSDLEHGVLHVDSFSFTLLAKIVIIALRTQISNANNWLTIAGIARVSMVNLIFLGCKFLLHVLFVERPELVGTVEFNLFSHCFYDVAVALEVELAGAVALTARKALIVYLGPLALETIN